MHTHTGALAISRAHFGEGSGSIYLDDVACHGTEEAITECDRRFDNHNCVHREDASVLCKCMSHHLIVYICKVTTAYPACALILEAFLGHSNYNNSPCTVHGLADSC